MDVNTEPTVNNIKTIIEENKLMHSWLEAENCLTIVEWPWVNILLII